MTPWQQQLVQEIVAYTGVAAPDWSAGDAPMLQADRPRDLYLVGVIGGKDVGKSSLINAMLGAPVAAVSNHGEGTSRVLAYVHEADVAAAEAKLAVSAAGAFDLVRHTIEEARGRVLLDLPDVDSVWDTHVELTRRMLRNMLFPCWVQSVEKYADRATLALLARVAEGNAPENFLFVLTKVDQLAERHGADAVEELKADFAARAAKACGIGERPAVYAVDGLSAQGFDLEPLRGAVLKRRTKESLDTAAGLAERRQTRTLSAWLRTQRIDEQLAAAKRSLDEADTALTERVVQPILERIATQPINAAMIEPTVRARIGYWPIVAAIDAVLAPALTVLRARSEPWSQEPVAGRQVAQAVRGLFADISQRQPRVAELLVHNKLWETAPSERAASLLEERLDRDAAVRQASLLERAATPSLATRLIAIGLTVGAALWFPLVQPALEIVLQQDIRHFTSATLLLVVQLIGATYLVRSVGFLVIYFFALWVWLRWHTVRRVERLLQISAAGDDPSGSLQEWSANLLLPLRRNVERLETLARRIGEIDGVERPAV